MTNKPNNCEVCGCRLHRNTGTYARPTPEGRSHASSHHYIPERFFGRSLNRGKTLREPIFALSPWDYEHKTAVLCYDCHEELIHNPVFLPNDIANLSKIVKRKALAEDQKPTTRDKIAGRIVLLHEIIEKGLAQIIKEGN